MTSEPPPRWTENASFYVITETGEYVDFDGNSLPPELEKRYRAVQGAWDAYYDTEDVVMLRELGIFPPTSDENG